MIDSHCHLDHEPLLNNINDVLRRSKEVGVKKLLTICNTFESFTKIKKLVKKDDLVLHLQHLNQEHSQYKNSGSCL